MKRLIIPPLLSILLFSLSYGFSLQEFIEEGKRKIGGKQLPIQIPFPATPSKREIKAHVPASTSCRAMLDNTPKNSLADEVAKYIFIGAASGGVAGTIVSRDMKGTAIGIMTGVGAAVIYVMAKTQHFQPEDPEHTAKRLGYEPSMGGLLNLEIPALKTKDYRKGQYVEIVLRVSLLTPEALQKKDNQKDELIPIWVNSYLVKDRGIFYPLSSESYYLIPGTFALPYYLPICDEIKPGNYKLRFQITGLGREVSREVDFRVSSK